MIDVARIASVRSCIKHRIIVEDEQKRVMPPITIIVPTIGFGVRDRFADIFVDALSFANWTDRECTTSLNGRTAHFIQRAFYTLG